MHELKPIKKLIFALSISGVLNIVLIAVFFYWMVKDTHPSTYFEQKPALMQEQQSPLANERGNAEFIHYFRTLSFEQLISNLSNHQLIENGYSQRDIALACLIAFHQFDMIRALVGYEQPSQHRSIVYGKLKSGKPALLTVYPGLSEKQFQALIDFSRTERWPFTSKGLFCRLKQGNSDPTLRDVFMMTQEFLSAEMLLNRADVSIKKTDVLKMLLEGNWSMLSNFAEQQKLLQDLSPARRQRFLMEYIDHKSKAAAYLMLLVDGEFALKKLDDPHVINLLELLSEKNLESEKYAKDLLTSPRSDAVWQIAASKLFQYAGEATPEKNVHHLAIRRFIPEYAQVVTETVAEKQPKKVEIKQSNKIVKPIEPKPIVSKQHLKKPIEKVSVSKLPPPQQKRKDRLYIVQEGDSLWKISRRFNVNIDTLRSYNKLKSDALKPGTPLKIP